MTTTTPVPQHLSALASANRNRFARAEMKRQINRGALTIAQVLDPDRELEPEIQNMPLGELLRAQDRWGQRRAMRFCIRANIGELRKIGALTGRQRRAVINRLAGRSPLDPLLDD